MTRINSGMPPKQLERQHLLAEHREIKRIPNVVWNHLTNSKEHLLEDLPSEFTLGTGHVRFFYNKLKYLHERYKEIQKECWRRGYNIEDYNESFERIKRHPFSMKLYNDWEETDEARKLIRERVTIRLEEQSKKLVNEKQ